MEIQKDFSELLELFNEHDVAYAIVGGYALAFHGSPRNTGDIDILVRPDRENAARVLRALADFGFGSLDLKVEDFSHPDRVLQLGYAPVRVDLITSLTGVSWEQKVSVAYTVMTAPRRQSSTANTTRVPASIRTKLRMLIAKCEKKVARFATSPSMRSIISQGVRSL